MTPGVAEAFFLHLSPIFHSLSYTMTHTSLQLFHQRKSEPCVVFFLLSERYTLSFFCLFLISFALAHGSSFRPLCVGDRECDQVWVGWKRLSLSSAKRYMPEPGDDGDGTRFLSQTRLRSATMATMRWFIAGTWPHVITINYTFFSRANASAPPTPYSIATCPY